MNSLLKISMAIDWLNERVGKSIIWLLLLAVVVSAINASVRKIFNTSSNAFLEIQWYLFSAVFLLGAAYTMLKQGHVKIDVILQRFPKRIQIMVEMFGIVFFLFPFIYFVITEMWPLAVGAIKSGESSENAGGLIRWPVYMLVPIGFVLLWLQGSSELIKRFLFLTGHGSDPTMTSSEKSAEEELAEVIRQQQELLEQQTKQISGSGK